MADNSLALSPPRLAMRLRPLLAHAIALPGAMVFNALLAQFQWPSGVVVFVLLEGLLAALVSRRLGLPWWWQGINLLFMPLLALALALDGHPGWYLAGLALLALTSLGALTNRVPLYLSSRQAHQAVLERLPGGDCRFLDLGSGLGGLLAHIARERPEVDLHGVETAPLSWLASRLRLGRKASLRLGSLWSEDLSRYDAVYAYLSPEPMPTLWEKVCREMRPGTLFISNTFTVPGHAPDEVVDLHDMSQGRLLVWRIR